MDRRKFLRLAGASALLVPGLAEAKAKAKEKKKKPEGNPGSDHSNNGMPRKTPIPETEDEKKFDKLSAKERGALLGRPIAHPYDITQGEAKLPPWDLGRDSASDKWMLQFRGNASHTFYGSGTVATDPKLLWKFKMADFATLHHGTPFTWKGTGWSGQSLRYGDYVWVGSTGGHFHCFEANTGKLVWYFTAERMFKGSPCFYKNRIYCVNVDNHLRCLDAATGKLIWKWVSPSDIDSSPRVVDDRLYVGGEDGAAKCFNVDTGEIIWKHDFGIGCCETPGSGGIESSVAISEGFMYFGHLDGNVRCLSTKDGTLKWATKIGGDTDASAVIVGDKLWIGTEEPNDGTNTFYCLAKEDGKVIWKMKIPTGVWSTPAYYDKKIYVGGNNGTMYCLEPDSGKEIWTFKIGASTWNSPSVVDGKVLFGSYDQYYRILDAKDGKLIWKYDIGDRCHSACAIYDGKFWVGSASGYYYCFGT